MDWRPIEIAPKDGKPILGTEPIDGGRWVTRVLSFSELNNCWRAMPGEYPYRPTTGCRFQTHPEQRAKRRLRTKSESDNYCENCLRYALSALTKALTMNGNFLREMGF